MARLRALTPVARWQDRNDPIRALAESQERKIKAGLHEALKSLRKLVPVREIAEKLKRGGHAGAAIAAIPFNHFEETLKAPLQHVGELFLDAGAHSAKQLKHQLKGRRLRYRAPHQRTYAAFGKDFGDGFDFDRFDADTQAKLHQIIDGLIGDLSDAAKETINAVVLDGVRNGDSFDDIAANIRDTITLTPSQAQAVANYRRQLEDLDPGALQRALRDTAYDDQIQGALDENVGLSDAMIEDAVTAYTENYLDYRANTIARTESLRAGNSGLLAGYQQAVDRGVMPEGAVTRQWQAAIDERTCAICLSIVERNKDGVGLNDQFQSDDGPVDDPPVHPNCRCTVQYETDLDMVPATDEE